jgi:hypothetical protein
LKSKRKEEEGLIIIQKKRIFFGLIKAESCAICKRNETAKSLRVPPPSGAAQVLTSSALSKKFRFSLKKKKRKKNPVSRHPPHTRISLYFFCSKKKAPAPTGVWARAANISHLSNGTFIFISLVVDPSFVDGLFLPLQ